MFSELLPRAAASAESFAPVGEEALFPSELALVERAQRERRAEFATARHCARRALEALGVDAGPILSGAGREPLWPDGVVGSITHCCGYHAAALGRTPRFRSIGIDAEPNEPLPEDVLEEVSLPAERIQSSPTGGAHSDRLLFSAKESVYKAWFPLAHRWLGFDEALVVLHADGTFDVEVTADGPLDAVRGRWLAREGLVLTAIAVPGEPSSDSAGVGT